MLDEQFMAAKLKGLLKKYIRHCERPKGAWQSPYLWDCGACPEPVMGLLRPDVTSGLAMTGEGISLLAMTKKVFQQPLKLCLPDRWAVNKPLCEDEVTRVEELNNKGKALLKYNKIVKHLIIDNGVNSDAGK